MGGRWRIASEISAKLREAEGLGLQGWAGGETGWGQGRVMGEAGWGDSKGRLPKNRSFHHSGRVQDERICLLGRQRQFEFDTRLQPGESTTKMGGGGAFPLLWNRELANLKHRGGSAKQEFLLKEIIIIKKKEFSFARRSF